MKYTKPWTIADLVAEDAWHAWLTLNAIENLDYQMIYKNEQVSLEFFDTDQAEAFALEFGL
jgi:phage baseplate assembly protein gpV